VQTAAAQIMEPREPWAHNRSPSGPTHRGSRIRENRHPCRYRGLRAWCSHWRFLPGASHGSPEPQRELRAWLRRSMQPTEISTWSYNSPFEANSVRLLYGDGGANGPAKGTFPHAASTQREVCVSRDHEFWSLVGARTTKTLVAPLEAGKTSGLTDLGVHSGVCKAAPDDINGRLTTGFEFRIWRDLCWHLQGCAVISTRLCLPDWQPVTLKRAIGDLMSKYWSPTTSTPLESCRCAGRGDDLVHCHRTSDAHDIGE
jgi:hypothetical protein